MKQPQTPPDWFQNFRKVKEGEAVARFLSKSAELSKNDPYLHWDNLRRHPAPEGLSHEEWWGALKLGRQGKFQEIPSFLDKKGRPFRFGLPGVLIQLLHEIDRGLGATFTLPDEVTTPATRDQYIVSTLALESITSSQLEGAVATREVAREMLRSGRPPRDMGERMILNNYKTMSRIRELATEPAPRLSPELVLELHRTVSDGTLSKPDAAGRLRAESENLHVADMEGTVFHQPPAAAELPQRIRAMCDFANGDTPGFFVHPAIRAIILHFWLAYDHPFVDGNGRTARALFYWAMLRSDYRLFEFISISQILLKAPAQYARAFLHTETDDNDLTYFLLHQAGVIREAVKNLHQYIARKKRRFERDARILQNCGELNHRQQALLAHALENPQTAYQIRAHQNSHRVSHQTARNDLFGLMQRGLLEKQKIGKSYIFRAPSDLAGKLTTKGAKDITKTTKHPTN
jgi:Fic family protein